MVGDQSKEDDLEGDRREMPPSAYEDKFLAIGLTIFWGVGALFLASIAMLRIDSLIGFFLVLYGTPPLRNSSMAERFIAFVPTLAPHTLSGPEIVEGLRQRFGHRIRLDLSARSAPDGGVVVEILGLQVAVMFVERPLPQDVYSRALMFNRTWPDASTAIAGTRAHVIVATLSGVENWSDAFRMAVAVTLVAAVASSAPRASE